MAKKYVGRGGEKLAFAFESFGIKPDDAICCDLGSHIGGFVDCWLQHGARLVYSVDTSYGTLDWNLRNSSQVIVMERTNALHVELPQKVDYVSCDVGWTRQNKVLPHALTLLNPGGKIISLIKPQYEADKKTQLLRGRGCIKEEAIPQILAQVENVCKELGVDYSEPVKTPFVGDKGGNPEFFIFLSVPDAGLT